MKIFCGIAQKIEDPIHFFKWSGSSTNILGLNEWLKSLGYVPISVLENVENQGWFLKVGKNHFVLLIDSTVIIHTNSGFFTVDEDYFNKTYKICE